MSNQTEHKFNRKEEILEKSRKLKLDEGVEYVQMQGANIGRLVIIFLVCVPLSALSALAGQMSTVWALGAVSCAFWFGEVFANYRFTKKKSDLVKTIVAVFVLMAFFYWFMLALYVW